MVRTSTALAGAVLAALLGAPALAESVVNVYSSRHYDTDERLYSDFTELTGIRVNRIDGKADELIARIQAEGANSPADVLVTVDTSRLERAAALGLLQPVASEILEKRIPAYLQNRDNLWFGFSQRARIIFYDRTEVTDPPLTYAELADPRYRGRVCARSSTNEYNQSILAAIIAHEGEAKAKDWAAGIVANFARDPQGGDTDQLKAIVSGECDIVLSNTYYYARSGRIDVAGLTEKRDMIGWVFPDQNGNGAHMNLSGAGVTVHAPNRENAVKFLEYLASASAQQYFSAGNDEYPAVAGIGLPPNIAALGIFKPDDIPASEIAVHLPAAQRIFNEVGWK